MKKGLLIYRTYNNVFNIGDYIQSLAASQFFLDKADVFICREELKNYAGDEVKMIMNGWFTHEPYNWPPSAKIFPLFVSFHINSVAREKLLNEESIKYLKSFEPIGCRDKETARSIKEKGIDSFFSGCLTLSLGMTYKSDEKSTEVYFVDPFFEKKTNIFSLAKYLLILGKNYKDIHKITKSYFKENTLKNKLKMSAFYMAYCKLFSKEILVNGVYINHIVSELDFKDEEAKFDYARKLLSQYAKAKLVITSRIHCALPCLGLETPVLYVEDVNQSETSFCRLDGLRELFNIVSYNKGQIKANFSMAANRIDTHFKVPNKDNYKQFRNKLIEKCKEFVCQN